MKQIEELEKALNRHWNDLLASEKDKLQTKMDSAIENLNKHIDDLEDQNQVYFFFFINLPEIERISAKRKAQV